VHEFGHYIFARIFNVKAEIFSIGFGPKIWARKKGETEVRISAFPLGGYVKLLGEDREAELSPEEAARALHKQAPWKRFLIFFGGPFFNFLFAILVFMIMMVVGEPKITSVIGRVVQDSAAEKAGFHSGDRIVAIDGKPVKSYDEIMMTVAESPKKSITFSVVPKKAASQDPVQITVTTSTESGYSMYGESTHLGQVDGMEMVARALNVGISDPSSPAGQAGFTTGDVIVKMNDISLKSWEELEEQYALISPGSHVKFDVKKADGKLVQVTLVKPTAKQGGNHDMADAWGLRSSELFVEKTVPESPAEASGLTSGDRLVAVGSRNVQSFFQLREAIQAAGEKEGKITLSWERKGEVTSSALIPTATQGRDPALKKTVQYTVGVLPMLVMAEPETYLERVLNPFVLVYRASERVVTFTWRNVVAIQKMLTGDVSVGTLGGPIMIGKIAGESLTRGLSAFLGTMAILSIGLGVLNILPVPVLDGGHLLLLAIEIVRGKPLTMRMMEIIQLVGLSLILLLMAVVIRNDLARLTYF